jgi:hypothetical protein
MQVKYQGKPHWTMNRRSAMKDRNVNQNMFREGSSRRANEKHKQG